MTDAQPTKLDRRTVLAAGLVAGSTSAALAQAEDAKEITVMPVPARAPEREDVAHLPNIDLYYRDTGGDGVPVVLLHPYTGSAMVWSYQQPVLVQAGYRVMAYSRRGFAGSGTGPAGDPGNGVDDLHALLDFLKIGRFHAVASAGGAFAALDYAISHPERVISMVLACSLLNVPEKPVSELIARITPPHFDDLPPQFRELGPSYRAANPEGTQSWMDLEKLSGSMKVRQPNKNIVTFDVLEKIRTPTLLMAGDSDLIAPPALQRLFLAHMPAAKLSVMPACGHSAYWEQPTRFNRDMLQFLGAHKT